MGEVASRTDMTFNVRFHPQFGMHKSALTCAMLRRAARLATEICASHKGEFFFHMIEHPIALF
jgi:hypothetical protein